MWNVAGQELRKYDYKERGIRTMARLKSEQTIREFDFETFRLEITETPKGARRIVGYLKSRRTGLPTDTMLFDDEERLGSLLDDAAEALQIVTSDQNKMNLQ